MAEAKKRVLVTISYSFSIRYVYRSGLLKKLGEFCHPVVGITWNQEDLVEELKNDGFEVYLVPESYRDKTYLSVRRKIDIWFKYFRLKSPSKKIQLRYKDSFLSFKKKAIYHSRELYNYLKFCLPYVSKRLLEKEKKFLPGHTNYKELESFINNLNIDAVFTVTPFHRQEDVLLQVCKNNNKLMLTSILSFDNITKRGWIPVEYDLYMVWNKHNDAELKRIYPAIKPKNIYVTGAVQFDFYFKEGYLLSNEEWRTITGLDKIKRDRKVILYAGGPKTLFPQEPDYVRDIDDAINSGAIKGDPVILLRCHPIDHIERWKNSLANCKNVVFDASWTGEKIMGETNVTEFDIKKLCSTLQYTDVHINICSTMTVDGSAFNKPQIGPAYYKNSATIGHKLSRLYWQEHFVPIMQTGAILLARSKEELIKYINSSLEIKTADVKASSKAILESTITYTDGNSTERVYNLLKEYITAN